MTASESGTGAGIFLKTNAAWRFPLAHVAAVCASATPLIVVGFAEALSACISRSSDSELQCTLKTSGDLINILMFIAVLLSPLATLFTYCLLRLDERRWLAHAAAGAANVLLVLVTFRWVFTLSPGYMGAEPGVDDGIEILLLCLAVWGAFLGWLFWLFAIRRKPMRQPNNPEPSA